jgi:hypothetical protein
MYAPNNIKKTIDFLGSQQKNNFFFYVLHGTFMVSVMKDNYFGSHTT